MSLEEAEAFQASGSEGVNGPLSIAFMMAIVWC